MIVRMKKIYLLAQKKNFLRALERLRETGVVHVEHFVDLKGERLTAVREELATLERAIAVLDAQPHHMPAQRTDDWCAVATAVVSDVQQIEQLTENITKRNALISRWEPWGDFDPADIAQLAAQGVHVSLYEIPVASLAKIPSDIALRRVHTEGGVAWCVVFSRAARALPFDTVAMPPQRLRDMYAQQAVDEKAVEQLEKKIREYTQYRVVLKHAHAHACDVVQFEEVACGLRDEKELVVLKGFCPRDACDALKTVAAAEHWGILIEEPTAEDQVPTLLRNPRWVEYLRPLLSVLNILPGYHEVDISRIFLIFFVIFVGMLVGDAGYGMLYLGALLFAHQKMRSTLKDPAPFMLGYILCVSAMVWGVFTGTYFGQAWLPTYIKPLIPWLNDWKHLQLFCFTLGLIHINLAHIWRIILKWPALDCLVDFGWLLISWVMFFAVKTLVLGYPWIGPLGYVLGVGISLVIFFPKFKIEPLLPLQVINMFTDIISYIRLFAIGLAGVAIADAANNLGGVMMVLLHFVNLILCVLAIMVHGVRLNVLEFSGHMGIEWTGGAYQPFKKLSES